MEYKSFYSEIENTVKKILERNIGYSNMKNTIDYDDEIINAICSLESAINDSIEYFQNRDENENN